MRAGGKGGRRRGEGGDGMRVRVEVGVEERGWVTGVRRCGRG